MKTVLTILFCLAVAILSGGCGKEENSLATDTATADDFAAYEEALAAANGEGVYDDIGDEATE